MKTPLVGAAILAALVTLAACGQRGPLYLPKPPDGIKAGGDHKPVADERR